MQSTLMVTRSPSIRYTLLILSLELIKPAVNGTVGMLKSILKDEYVLSIIVISKNVYSMKNGTDQAKSNAL